jgi:hypothetical protein
VIAVPCFMKRLALCLAMLLPISSTLSGCSWIFVQPIAPRYERSERLDCTTNRAAPVIDTILTVTNLASAAYVAGQDNVTNKGTSVTLGLLVGAMWLSSAIYGYSKTSECEDALAEDEAPGPHLHLRAPPPAVGYPAGVPAERPPTRESPTVTLPPPPAAPAPAARNAQVRDADDPSARPRPAPALPQQADPE